MKALLTVFILIVLGYLLLLLMSLSVWLKAGFTEACLQLKQLIDAQQQYLMRHETANWYQHLPALPQLPKGWLTLTTLPLPHHGFTPFQQEALYPAFKQFTVICRLTANLLKVKLQLSLSILPMLLLASLSGLIDGLHYRAKRRACLGRESAFVFHQLNRLLKRLLGLVMLAVLALPVTIDPGLLSLAVSGLLVVLLTAMVSRFKKYC